MEPLLQKNFMVDTISFSGHGRAPSLQHAFTIQNCAHEVLEWLNTHQRRSIDIFGYSMGGYVALWLARFYPDRVGKIFTLGTKLEWSPEIADRETKMLNAEKIAAKVPAFARELADRHGEHEWHSVLHKTAHLMNDLGKHHLSGDDFKEIKSKVILGLGDGDTMVSKDETLHVRGLIPDADFQEIKDCLHPFEKVPIAAISKEIIAFFGQ